MNGYHSHILAPFVALLLSFQPVAAQRGDHDVCGFIAFGAELIMINRQNEDYKALREDLRGLSGQDPDYRQLIREALDQPVMPTLEQQRDAIIAFRESARSRCENYRFGARRYD
ncbi:hypothetical protein [Aestuariivita sp.]|jgi:hypothetical protein|uniref:hypothetical protein n=1 Tax=Aestuariivita sp. TaxID=1872407 RepID=UPI0021747EFA|nr:hypothetical protein [Aestuariivita sp.]MCE8007134.1 hypothetical protein [Aestuariivita sp.]